MDTSQDNDRRGWAARSARLLRGHWTGVEPLFHHVYRLPLVWALLCVLLGAKLSSWLAVGEAAWAETAAVGGASLAGVAAAGLVAHGMHRLAGAVGLLALALLGFYLGVTQMPDESDALSAAASRQAQPIAVRCLIESTAEWLPNPLHRPADPSSQPWRTRWQVRCEAARDHTQWVALTARCPLTCDGRVDDLLPGDVVEVFGSFRRIMPPTNPGGFDYAQHFRQQDMFCMLTADDREQIHKRKSRPTHFWLRLRARAVRAVDGWLHRWVSAGQAELAAALVIGSREQVDWQDQQQLMATGTLHLLAISGLHVEIVAGTILLLCNLLALRNRTTFFILLLVCGTYAALAGGKPPVLRAVIIVATFSLARVLGRDARLANALCLAGLILLLWRVAHLDNVGVQLSFLAVASIGLFVLRRDVPANRRRALQSLIEASQGWWQRWLNLAAAWLMNMFRLSLWVWLMTCPMVWTHFHVVAPISIPLNIIIAIPLSISLLTGLVTAVFGWIAPVGYVAGGICGQNLALIAGLVRWGESIVGGHFWLPAPPTWWSVCFYLIVGGWLLAFGRRRTWLLACLLGCWILLGLAPLCFGVRGYLTPHEFEAWPKRQPLTELRCTFLDVGHGTSVILELPTGEVWLYDAGHLGAAERSHQDIASALWQISTARIDTLWISHADVDHYNAVAGLAHRFGVGRVISTAQFWGSEDPPVRDLIADLERDHIPREVLQAPASGNVGGVAWRVLHPRQSKPSESDNASSLCLLIEFAGKRILLPGDLEGSGILSLTELPPRPCHVLMAPHHGSLSIDPQALLQWCQPRTIVISGNHRANRPEVVAKYSWPSAQLGITHRDGAVQIRIGADGRLQVFSWHGDVWLPLADDPVEGMAAE